MSSKVDLKIYLEGYKNVSKKAQELGVEDLDKRKEELENQIKKAEEKEIKEELRKFLLNVGKVDRGEETIPMASDVEASKTKENEQKQTRKENKENEEYLKAWDEAIKENEIRDAWAEAEKENKQREAAKNLISKKEYAKYTDELPFDIEITLGRKGVIIYNQKEYKIPRRALRNTDELDSLEIITAIEETGMKIEDPKMLEQILKISPTDYTVIQGICMAKKMENSDKATILNNYFNECFKASKHEKVNNICNITYDLNDISKASTMKEYDRFSFLQKAKRAERYNIGKQEGRFKPTFFSKIMDKILGEGSLEKLAEKNETREIENATAINTALSKDDVTEAHNFLNSLKVDQKQNIGKDFERTTLDDEQMKEIKNVYAEEAQKREEGESR